MSSLLKKVNARKIKKERWVILQKKWGKKTGRVLEAGGFKKIKKFKNLPLQVPPKKRAI